MKKKLTLISFWSIAALLLFVACYASYMKSRRSFERNLMKKNEQSFTIAKALRTWLDHNRSHVQNKLVEDTRWAPGDQKLIWEALCAPKSNLLKRGESIYLDPEYILFLNNSICFEDGTSCTLWADIDGDGFIRMPRIGSIQAGAVVSTQCAPNQINLVIAP